MQRVTLAILILFTISGGTVAFSGESFSYERYRPIIDRNPFGLISKEPKVIKRVDPGPTQPALQQESITKFIRLCALTRTAKGVRVGFVHTEGKNSSSHLMRVGDKKGDFAVISADLKEKSAEISYKGQTETLTLGMVVSSAERIANNATANTRKTRGGTPNIGNRPTRGSTGRPTSYHEMLKKRREAEQRRVEAEDARRKEDTERLTGEALRKHLREYNMKLIREKGQMGPPLPITLTPEEDAQLVNEGVLPPPGAPVDFPVTE